METAVNEIDYKFIANVDNPDRFVFMYSRYYEDITKCPMIDAYSKRKANLIEGYLEIKNKDGKPIYRRFRGCGVSSNSVYLSYRSMRELGLKNGDEVSVKPTSWFKYLIHNSDSYIKYTVIFAIVGVICSILSCILAIIQIIFSFI